MNRRGVLGMPVRLAMAILILALCVPPLAAAVEDYRGDNVAAEASDDAEAIAGAAAAIYYEGEGSSATVHYSLPDGCTVEIGGEGQDAFTVRVVSGGETQHMVSSDHPTVRYLNPLTLTGSGDIRLVCGNDDIGYGIWGERA